MYRHIGRKNIVETVPDSFLKAGISKIRPEQEEHLHMGLRHIRKPHQTESLTVESQNSPDRQHPYMGLTRIYCSGF